jgi:hypothetical protein
MKAGIVRICCLILAAVVTALLYTYPLVLNLSTQFPGFTQSDTCLSIWNIWHLKKALLENFDFFAMATKYIFYPQQPSLILHNYIMTSGLLSLPFQALFTPIVSMNLIFLIQFILTAAGMYALTVFYSNNKIAGIWAGITLAFCPYVIIQSCYFLHFSSIWFFPWFIYFFSRFLDRGRLKFGALAAVVYGLCLLEDQTYFLILSMLAILLAINSAGRKRDVPVTEFMKNAALSTLVFLVLAGWYLTGLLVKAGAGNASFPVFPDTAIDYFSLHASGLFRPSPLLTLYRSLPYVCTPIMHITSVFAGYIPLFFAGFALIRLKHFSARIKRIILFWSLAGGLFYLLASGPLLFGNDPFMHKFAPYNLVCSGILRQLRIPARFSLITIISIYVLAAFGVDQFTTLKKGKLLSGISAGIFLIVLQVIEFMPIPYPLLDLTAPREYAALAGADKGSPVLILPLGWQSSYRTVGTYAKEIQYYQTIHGHPIFQGQIARIENSYFDYYTSQPGFRYLIEAGRRFPTSGEESAVHGLLREYGIKHVIIHMSYFDREHLIRLQKIFSGYHGVLSVQML